MLGLDLELAVTIVHAAQVALSLEASYHSYIAIINLKQYEDKTEKAAEYSKTAEDQLYKTRTTEASGAGAILLSFISAIYLFLHPQPSWPHLAVNLLSLFAGMGARVHMADFWRKKTPIPLVQGFNTALERTENVQQRLTWLEIVWLTSALITAFATRPKSAS